MFKRFFKRFFVVLGVIFALLLILAITPAPFYMHHNLGHDPNKDTTYIFEPQHVIMMGGAGMPSASNLMRLYCTAGLATTYECPVTIALPYDSTCHAEMDKYLVSQGVTTITHDTIGTNTRSQVLGLAENYLEGTVDFNLSLKKQRLKGREKIPSIESTNMRYTFWNYLKLEIDTFREYFALFYYKIKGWI